MAYSHFTQYFGLNNPVQVQEGINAWLLANPQVEPISVSMNRGPVRAISPGQEGKIDALLLYRIEKTDSE